MFQIWSKIVQKGALLTGRPNEIVERSLLAAMHEATQYGQRRVKLRTPQGVMGAQGGLMASIQAEVRKTSRGVIGLVGTAHQYGLVVEKGRRPGMKMPPGGKGRTERPLLRWIEVKMGETGKEADRIEFLLRRKIGRKGTKGALMFEKTLQEDWPTFQNIFERHGVKITRELAK